MDDDDTLILTPEEKEKILKDIPDEESQDEENKED
jgi:hypothetical protein